MIVSLHRFCYQDSHALLFDLYFIVYCLCWLSKRLTPWCKSIFPIPQEVLVSIKRRKLALHMIHKYPFRSFGNLVPHLYRKWTRVFYLSKLNLSLECLNIDMGGNKFAINSHILIYLNACISIWKMLIQIPTIYALLDGFKWILVLIDLWYAKPWFLDNTLHSCRISMLYIRLVLEYIYSKSISPFLKYFKYVF